MSTPAVWTAVDAYLVDQLLHGDPAVDGVFSDALAAATAAGLPPIAVTPLQGRLLQLLVRLRGARAVLEIGTLGGYSALWLARGLPETGRLVTLERDPHHAAVARATFARAGLADRIALRDGDALATLPALHAEGARFDLVFIDADKANVPAYYEWALRLATPGAAIIVDNVMRRGDVLATASTDPDTLGLQAFLTLLRADRRVEATALQTVGEKGYDGLLLAVVR